MVTTEDLAHVIYEEVRREAPRPALPAPAAALDPKTKRGFFAREPFLKPYTSLPRKKIFLSERDLKALWSPGSSEIEIPENALVSPLAEEWILLRRIRVLRKGSR